MDEETELRQMQEERAQLRLLFEHKGWKRFLEIIQAAIDSRVAEAVAKRANSLDELIAKNYDLGYIGALAHSITVLRGVEESLTISIDQANREVNEELENNDGN